MNVIVRVKTEKGCEQKKCYSKDSINQLLLYK